MPFVTRPRRRRGRPIGGPYPGSVTTRNLIMQSATMQTFITIPETTATGDFRITSSVYFTGSTLIVYGNDANFNNRVRIIADGSIQTRIRDDSATLSSAAGAVPLNRFSNIAVERSGSTVTLEVNETVVLTNTSNNNLGPTSINAVSRSSTSYGEGFIRNLNFVSGFSINATYPLDDTLITDEIRDTSGNNSNGTASASLSAQFSESYQVIDVGFLQVANLWTFGDYTFTGSEGAGSVLIGSNSSPSIEIGSEYRWSYVRVGDGDVRFRVGETVSQQTSAGSYNGDSVVSANDDLLFQNQNIPLPLAGSTITDTTVNLLLRNA